MRKEYLKFRYIIEIKIQKDDGRMPNLARRIAKYLQDEFDVKPKKLVETKTKLAMLCDEDFNEDKVADYILGYIHPDDLSIYNNE
jgi:hypothetical protein